MEEEGSIECENTKEVAPALIAVHPLDKYVVVAIGPELRVFDLREQKSMLLDNSGGPSHSDAIRSICFGANGKLFASAGDDKLVKIWRTDSWQCLQTVCSEKRLSAVAISQDGLFVTFADKFGVVWVTGLDEDCDSHALIDKKAVPMLGHYCSIITGLKFSPDGRFIVTADRDFKIRITKFPTKPLTGAHEIQSFCLGHTDFVSCVAFVSSPDHPSGYLLSGGGDSTVRLWDYISGSLLDTCEVGGKVGLLASNEAEKEAYPAVTDIHAFPDGSLIAVAIQTFNGIVLLKCEFSTRRLSVSKVVSLEDNFVPTRIWTSDSSGLFWMIMGASNLPSSGTTKLLAHVRVIDSHANAHDPIVVEDKDVPGGEKLLTQLQGSLDLSKDGSLAATAAALKVAMHNLLIKKQYPLEKRELRKKSRNDRKQKL